MPVTGQRVVRRALGRRLYRLRVGAGRSRRDVVDSKVGISEPTLHRIETGKVPVTPANVRALCRFYRVDQSATDALAELAVGTSRAQWWDASPVIPDWFKLYVGLEASATRICVYDAEVVPGEVQTEAYALAVFAAAQATDEEAARRHVKLRMQRQRALFSRRPAPDLVLVLGEGVLRRPVGGPAVLREQVGRMRELAERPTVEVRVLPFAVGGHAAMAGAFRILDFDDPEDPDTVYLESHIGAHYLEEPEEVAAYRVIFDRIRSVSVDLSEFLG